MVDAMIELEADVRAAIALGNSDSPREAVWDQFRAIEDRIDTHLETLGDAAPAEALRELVELLVAFVGAGRGGMATKLVYAKLLPRINTTLERSRFAAYRALSTAACGCAAWRQVANDSGGSLAGRPNGSDLQVERSVRDAYEEYDEYMCTRCGAKWTADHNPDSEPSVTRWWPR